MEELLEQAWNLKELPQSSDQYIMHVCALMSAKNWPDLEELLHTPAKGIPDLWRAAMLRHCKAEDAHRPKPLNPAAAPFIPKSQPTAVRYAAGPPLNGFKGFETRRR